MEIDLSPCPKWKIPKDCAIDRAYSDLILKANFLIHSKTKVKGHCPLQHTLNWIPFIDTHTYNEVMLFHKTLILIIRPHTHTHIYILGYFNSSNTSSNTVDHQNY